MDLLVANKSSAVRYETRLSEQRSKRQSIQTVAVKAALFPDVNGLM